MIKYLGVFATVGFAIPVILTVVWFLLEKHNDYYLSIGDKIIVIQLMIWPSSIFMMATAAHEGIDFVVLSLSITVNVLLYTVLGYFIWMGIYKHHWILYAVATVIIFAWYKLLNL
ncbi:MAG: hypothetical protein GY795_16315 [Desulfobacterales bacterium]|nr:hypothetical protein [Desulfobacterales bacterium]